MDEKRERDHRAAALAAARQIPGVTGLVLLAFDEQGYATTVFAHDPANAETLNRLSIAIGAAVSDLYGRYVEIEGVSNAPD